MGVASAALGLSLVGGGTWAAFSDTETVKSTFAAGELNFQVQTLGGQEIVNGESVLNINNMKPGDTKKYMFDLNNIGSLAIKEIFIKGERMSSEWSNGATPYGEIDADFANSEKEFLKQFKIKIQDGHEADPIYDGNLWTYLKDTTERDVIAAASAPGRGLPVDTDIDRVVVTLEFQDLGGRGGQNKFMNDKAAFKFILTATQWEGIQTNQNGNQLGGTRDGMKNTQTNNGVESTDYNKNQNYEVDEVIN